MLILLGIGACTSFELEPDDRFAGQTPESPDTHAAATVHPDVGDTGYDAHDEVVAAPEQEPYSVDVAAAEPERVETAEPAEMANADEPTGVADLAAADLSAEIEAVASVEAPTPEVPPEASPEANPAVEAEAPHKRLLDGNQVLAFYGKPGAKSMGILGEYSKEKLAPLLEGYARLYDEANGEVGVIPALYLIYGTCWPAGEIGILKRSVVLEYVAFAAERGWLVFLDHQLGKYGVEDSVRTMLPFLHYPNVHLAIDPEWRTLKPMEEIGYITGAELNESQRIIDEYLRDNDLPGERMLVVHQFRASMIRDAERVHTNFDRVVLVHTSDGFGPPALKRNTYAYNAKAQNMPVKGFKLFFESKVVGAGSDKPLMKPADVLNLDPMPAVVMYQ
ncbi:MAG: hypothetical protein JXM71_11370 [Spirochaetales bacterium]|nr:hypothetical protein [Spirochaetales bacterium]